MPKRAVKVTLIVEYEDGTRAEQGFFHLGDPFEFEIICAVPGLPAGPDGGTPLPLPAAGTAL